MDLNLIPEGAKHIISEIESSNHEAFLVGGCVRDLLLGKTPHDWDITTDISPIQIIELFGEENTIPTGIKHGTVTVVTQDGQYEVTTYRIDGQYTDHRHPDSVLYCDSLEKDLSRRDFTINAMAMDVRGNLIDPFNGHSHLEHEIIMCVGNPNARFQEDPLRILRAARFASVLGFNIESKTRSAMLRHKELLSKVARERITVELCKLLSGKTPGTILSQCSPVLFQIIPALKACDKFQQHHPWHRYDVLTHILSTVDAVSVSGVVDEEYLPVVRMAALLHDVAKPKRFSCTDGIGHFYGHEKASAEISEYILDNQFKFSNKQKTVIIDLIELHGTRLPATTRVARRWMARCGKDELLMLTCLQIADIIGSGMPEQIRSKQELEIQSVKKFQDLVLSMNPAQEVLSEKDISIGGKDLIQLGYSQGPEIGNVLKRLTKLVMEEKIENTPEVLIEEAKKIKERIHK